VSELCSLDSPALAREWCRARRAEGLSLGFVPTMGFLHEGHLSLVSRALAENDLCAVSIFVNPLQFDEGADLEAYPRDWEGDTSLLREAGADLVFTGTLAQFFEGELDAQGNLPGERLLDPGPGAHGLEGACRSGHFEGVATIVDRLFEVVGPDRAYFGQKDLQQTLVVRDLAARRGSPEVVVCPTSREPSGLARSSRNARLGPEELQRATCISRALFAASRAWLDGEPTVAALEELLAGARVERLVRAEMVEEVGEGALEANLFDDRLHGRTDARDLGQPGGMDLLGGHVEGGEVAHEVLVVGSTARQVQGAHGRPCHGDVLLREEVTQLTVGADGGTDAGGSLLQ